MIIKLVFVFILNGLALQANSQQIDKWKLSDLMKYYSKNNDTTYVVNFWRATSKPSLDQMPLLHSIAKSFEDRKVKLLLVSLDTKKVYETTLKNVIEKRRIKAQVVWLDEANVNAFSSEIDSNWDGVTAATLIINSNVLSVGKERRFFFKEHLTEEELTAAILNARFPSPYPKYKHRYISPTANPFFLTPFVNAAIYRCLEMIKDPLINRCGVTYFTSSQKQVYNMCSGRVEWIGNNGIYNVMSVRKDSASILYYNLEKVFVNRNDSIIEGQIIGEAYKGLHDRGSNIYHKDEYVTGVDMTFMDNYQKRLDKKDFIIRKKDE